MRLGPSWFAIGLLILPLTGCGERAPTPAREPPLGASTPRDHAFKGDLYLLPAGTERLPDLRGLQPAGALYVPRLDIPDQALEAVFPAGAHRGLPFAIDYRAGFMVDRPDSYRFQLLSDDGARLLVDGRLLIENGGEARPGPGQATVSLARGAHRIEVQYFQDPTSRVALQLGCQAHGGPMRPFPDCGLELASTSLWRVWLIWVAVLASLGAAVIWQTRRRIARENAGLR